MGFFETAVRIKDKVFEENMKVFYLFFNDIYINMIIEKERDTQQDFASL